MNLDIDPLTSEHKCSENTCHHEPITKEPEIGKRYLVLFRCHKGIHTCLAWDLAYPCCEWNILYYIGNDHWAFSTNDLLLDSIVLCWTELPEIPKGLLTYES